MNSNLDTPEDNYRWIRPPPSDVSAKNLLHLYRTLRIAPEEHSLRRQDKCKHHVIFLSLIMMITEEK